MLYRNTWNYVIVYKLFVLYRNTWSLINVYKLIMLYRNTWNYVIVYKLLVLYRNTWNYQAAVVSILLYGCTTWTLAKRLEKKLDGNCTKMLRAISNKSWRQHPTRHQLYDHLPSITKTIQVRQTRHVGHCWRSKDELISDVLLWTPHMAGQKQDDQLEQYKSST